MTSISKKVFWEINFREALEMSFKDFLRCFFDMIYKKLCSVITKYFWKCRNVRKGMWPFEIGKFQIFRLVFFSHYFGPNFKHRRNELQKYLDSKVRT